MTVGDSKFVNQFQKHFWSDGPGKTWVARDEVLTRLFHKVTEGLVDRVEPNANDWILDVGCGSGATTIAFAQRVGADGSILGVDISQPLLSQAKTVAQASGVDGMDFIHADAQTHAFDAGAFDHLVSRFGVMFFADPVAALSNLRQALRPGGKLCFACWGAMDRNPWFSVPFNAVVSRLGPVTTPPPHAAGPLGFADKTHVLELLQNAGFSDYRAESATIELHPSGGVDDVAKLATGLGPAMRTIDELDGNDADRAAIVEMTVDAMAQYQTPDGVRVPAEIWYYTAVND